jgi:hypothetical protein
MASVFPRAPRGRCAASGTLKPCTSRNRRVLSKVGESLEVARVFRQFLILAIFVLLPKNMQSDSEILPVPNGTPIGEFAQSKTIRAESLRPITTYCWNPPLNAFASLRNHWPEYLREAGEIALYVFLVCAFATLSERLCGSYSSHAQFHFRSQVARCISQVPAPCDV